MSHYNVLAEFEKSSDRTETRGYFRGIWSNDTPEECDEEIQNEFINVQEENLQRSSITFPNEVHEQNVHDPKRMTLSNNIAGDFEDNLKSVTPKSVDGQSGFIWSGNAQETSLTSKHETSHESLIKTHSDDFDFENVENKDIKETEKRTANNDTKKEEDKQAFSDTEFNLHDFETDATDYFDSEDEYFETYRNNFEDSPMFAYHGMIHSPLPTSAVNGRYSEGVSRYNNMPVFVTSLQKFAKANGFTVHNVMADGNCLFRAINDQLSVNGIFGNCPESLRKNTIKYLRENPYQEDGSHTESFLFTENWEQYLSRMEQSTEWCDHVIFKAAVDALGLRVVVFNVYGDDIRRTEVMSRKQSVDILTIYLGHFGEFHYLSLRPNNWETEWQKSYENYVIQIKALMYRHQLPIRQFESMRIKSDKKNDVDNFPKISSTSDFETEIQTDWKCSEKFGYTVCPVYGLEDLDMEENEEPMHRLVEDPFYIDTRTGLPLQHLSYLMKHLIPPNMDLVNSFALPPVQKDGTTFQYLGSFATGTYAFLKDITRGYTSRNLVKKDATVVALRPLTSGILIDTKDTHPGFLRLKVLSMSHIFPERNLHRCEDNVFLKRLDVPDNMPLPKRSERCYMGFSSGEFPLAAEEWQNRQRKFKWPSQNVVAAIHNAGCTIIPKHHPRSCNPEIEWKFNFTNSEMLLFTRAVTENQCRGFILLQILINYSTCNLRCKLKMKHTKAVFLNCCEQVPVEKWETNLSGCILHAFVFLLACLRKRNLPHYFIPSFNLFENFKEGDLESIRIQIEAIRLFPVQTLNFLAENYGYTYGANLSRLVLQDCKRFASSRDIMSTYHDVFVPGTIRTVKFLTRQGHYEAAYYLLNDTYASHLCFAFINPIDLSSNFTEFFRHALNEIHQEASKTILAKKFEKEYGINVMDSVMSTGGLLVADILPWGVNYEIANLHIPMEKTSNFDLIGDFFYEYSKTEVKRYNSNLATLGISEAIRCFERAIQEEPVIDVEIDDAALIKDIQSQKSESMQRIKEKLMYCYIHTMKISKMHRTFLPLEMYMPAIEELCQELPDMSGVVSVMYQYLNNHSKQKEYETRFDSFFGTGVKEPSRLKHNRF